MPRNVANNRNSSRNSSRVQKRPVDNFDDYDDDIEELGNEDYIGRDGLDLRQFIYANFHIKMENGKTLHFDNGIRVKKNSKLGKLLNQLERGAAYSFVKISVRDAYSNSTEDVSDIMPAGWDQPDED